MKEKQLNLYTDQDFNAIATVKIGDHIYFKPYRKHSPIMEGIVTGYSKFRNGKTAIVIDPLPHINNKKIKKAITSLTTI